MSRETTAKAMEQSIFQFYEGMLKQFPNRNINNEIISVVFSKDRAMQLHAFISSFTKHVINRGALYVLYKTTSVEHQNSYHHLADLFKGEDVFFLEEFDFRAQVIQLCEGFSQDKVAFYADDFIFLRPVDYRAIALVSSEENVVALGLGEDMIYSTGHMKPIVQPELIKLSHGFLVFDWNGLQTPGNWTYPISVGAYIYSRYEMCAMLNSIEFYGPNSLESALQVFKPIFLRRRGVCPERVVCAEITANKIQNENDNIVIEKHSIEDLLGIWNSGKIIDINFFEGRPIKDIQLANFRFVDR